MLVSAAIADGPPRRVLEVISESEHELVLPEPVVGELQRVLAEKIGLSADRVDGLLALLDEIAAERASCPDMVEPRSGDPDDDRILATAMSAGVDILASGDTKHLLPLVSIGRMRIVRPAELLSEISV